MLCLDLGVPLIRVEFRTYRAREGGIRVECQFADFGTNPTHRLGGRRWPENSVIHDPSARYQGHRTTSASRQEHEGPPVPSTTAGGIAVTRIQPGSDFSGYSRGRTDVIRSAPPTALKEHFLGVPAVGRTNPHVHLRRAINSMVGFPSPGRPHIETRE
jgi:hypothetical protein